MEPIGLAVGVLGLAGLFSTCLDAVERFDSWRHFSEESRALSSRWETQKLRIKRWGHAVGIDNAEESPEHHEALQDPKIASTVREHLSIIENLCTNADSTFSSAAKTSAGHAKFSPFFRDRNKDRPGTHSVSGRQRVKWALRDKAKCTAQVEMLGFLVQDLYDLVPPDGLEDTKPAERTASDGIIGDDFASQGSWPVELDQILARMEKEFETETRKKLHSWLLGRDVSNELFDNAVHKRVDGTCNWILEQNAFVEWVAPDFPAESAKILWINGARGFGKTILCARIVEHLRSTLDSTPAHFFFSSDFETRKDPFVAVRSWLTQLLSHPTVFELAWKEWEAHDSQVATRADVIRIFRESVVAVPACTFILDGLDECAGMGHAWDIDDTTSVAAFLETIQQTIAKTNTRMLVVCRDEPEIRQSIMSSDGLTWFDFKISSDHVQADNELYSRSIVKKKLENKSEEMRSDLSQRLTNCCNGQFLWIKMLEPLLRSGKNKKQLEAAIDTSPAGLDQLYDRDWQRILGLPQAESSRAVSLLRWAAFALRPLTIDEITEALLITDDDSDFPVDEMPDSIDESYVDGEILGLCGSLIEIRNAAPESSIGSRTVHLAHFSVKEFFISRMSHDASLTLDNKDVRNTIETTQSNMLAMKCLRYINFPNVWKSSHNEADEYVMSFVNYAGESWYEHAATGKSRSSDVIQAINAFFSHRNEQYYSWARWFDEPSEQSLEDDQVETTGAASNPLYYASRLGLAETVAFLITQEQFNVNETTPDGTTGLIAGCISGDARIVSLLLEEGADVTIANNKGLTALFEASRRGHTELVQLLIEKNADVTAVTKDGWTSLHEASRKANIEIARLLLANGAHVDAQLEYGYTPFHIACYFRHIEVVRLLLENGANIDAMDNDGWTALFLASNYGNIEVVQLLLDKDADMMAMDKNGWTALHTACQEGHIEIVQLLIDGGADVMAMDQDGWTPLFSAARNGQFRIAQLLLNSGADITKTLKQGDTTLHVASQNGNIELIQLLMDKGVDVMAMDEDGWTALHIAAQEGHIAIVQSLLNARADVTATLKDGQTALHIASKNNHVEIIQLLIDKESDVMAMDEDGLTPLFIASQVGNFRIVQLLLEQGADVMAITKRSWTALHIASQNGHLEVVRLLLENRADVTMVEKFGQTALHIASIRGHLEVVQLLLEEGADLMIANENGWTALHAASENGHLEVAQCLSEGVTDAEAVDFDGRTAFFLACTRGHVRVAELLLNRKAVACRADRYGATPLFAAARNRHEKVVAYLMALDCDIGGFYDGFGHTLLWWASKNGKAAIIEMALQLAIRKGIQVQNEDLAVEPRSMGADGTYCDVCTRYFEKGDKYYECADCRGGDFDLCQECFHMGASCDVDSHVLSLREP